MARSAPRDPATLGELGAESAGSHPTQTIDIDDAGRIIRSAIADVRIAARQLVAEAKKAGAILAAAQEVIDPDDWIAFCREHGVRQKAVRRFIAVHHSPLHETVVARDGLMSALTYLASQDAREGDDD